MLQEGSHSPALSSGYDGLKRFVGSQLSLLCSYAIRLYVHFFVCIVQKWYSTGSVCL